MTSPQTVDSLNTHKTGSSHPMKQRWLLHALAFLVTLFALAIFYAPTFSEIFTIWQRSDTYAYGILIPPIVLYLIWCQREDLNRLKPVSQPAGLIGLVLLSLFWLLGYLISLQVAQQLAVVAMIPVLVYSLFGGAVVRSLLFPLIYLFFAVPVGESVIVPILQNITAQFSVELLRLTGITINLDGHYITTAAGDGSDKLNRFRVAEACSGINYLLASVAFGSLFAYLNYKSYWRRAAFIAFSAIIPMVANVLRVCFIILLAYFYGTEQAAGIGHLIYGWVMFTLIVALMLLLGTLWREPSNDSENKPTIALTPVSDTTLSRPFATAITTLLSLLILFANSWLVSNRLNVQTLTSDVQLPLPAAPVHWSGPLNPDDDNDWQPVFRGTQQQLHRIYRLDQQNVHFFVAYYPHSHSGAELISSSNRFYDDKHWKLIARNKHSHAHLTINEERLKAGSRRLLVWYWYQVAGYQTASPVAAKFLSVLDFFNKPRQGAKVVALAAEYRQQPAQAERILTEFLKKTAIGRDSR